MSNLVSVEKKFSDLTKRRGFLPSLIDKDILIAGRDVFQLDWIHLKTQEEPFLLLKSLMSLKKKMNILED